MKMKNRSIECPYCHEMMNDGDYVASKYPDGLKRKIEEYVDDPNSPYGKWVKGNTYSNTHFYRCHNCGKNVQVWLTAKVERVEE